MASSNAFDWDSFFDHDDFKRIGIDNERVLRSTIFVLTKLIAGYRVSEPHPTPTIDPELRLWSNLSAILSTVVAGPVVAVTGIVTVEEEQLLICLLSWLQTMMQFSWTRRLECGERPEIHHPLNL